MLIPHPYYSEDDDGGSGAGDAGDVKASDIRSRYGSGDDANLRLAEKVADLENKLYRLRGQKRTLTEERDALKAKVPSEDSAVLSKADALLLESYKALGKPSEIDAALKSKSTAEQDLATMRRADQIRTVAELTGFKPSVLSTLAADLDLQVKETDGKQQAVIVADGKETPLADYAQAEWADFLPALQAKPQSYDINAGARGPNTQTKEDAIAANRLRLAQRAGRY